MQISRFKGSGFKGSEVQRFRVQGSEVQGSEVLSRGKYRIMNFEGSLSQVAVHHSAVRCSTLNPEP
jgi:hypothetical protein